MPDIEDVSDIQRLFKELKKHETKLELLETSSIGGGIVPTVWDKLTELEGRLDKLEGKSSGYRPTGGRNQNLNGHATTIKKEDLIGDKQKEQRKMDVGKSKKDDDIEDM